MLIVALLNRGKREENKNRLKNKRKEKRKRKVTKKLKMSIDEKIIW